MATINELDSATSLNGADKVPIYSTTDGDARKASLTLMAQFFQSELTGTGFYTQRIAPATTGYTVQVSPLLPGSNVWLLLKQSGALAAGTIKLPVAAECLDGQELLVSATQALTSLTVDGNGATVAGAPVALAANSFFRIKFDLIDNTWYRVG